jgi:hypothetical protein
MPRRKSSIFKPPVLIQFQVTADTRRAIHASCDSPCHLSAKHGLLRTCLPRTAPFRSMLLTLRGGPQCLAPRAQEEWVGSGRVTLRHVSPIPPLDPYVRLSPHTAHERGILRERSISPAPRSIHRGQLSRSLGTFVLFPDPLPQALRHVRSFPTLGLLWPI